MFNNNEKILIIGKCFTKKNPLLAGGIIILFESLKKQLNQKKIDYDLIDINYKNYSDFKFISYFKILFKLFFKIKSKEMVMLNVNFHGLLYYSPFILFLKFFYSFNYSIRIFAGNLDFQYEKSNIFSQKIVEYSIRKCDKIFYETKYLINFFSGFNENSFWFPNLRDKSNFLTSKSFKKKFVYLGLVRKEKGIDLILNTFKNLKDYEINIYGPIIDGYIPSVENKLFFENNYRGPIDQSEITNVLSSNDVLVLPTFWKGEGYPGVIIEAMSVGLPVIASNMRGIKELLGEDSKNLVDLNIEDSFLNSVLSINEKNYKSLREDSIERFKLFDNKIVMDEIIELIKK